jgi:hypothetical protein
MHKPQNRLLKSYSTSIKPVFDNCITEEDDSSLVSESDIGFGSDQANELMSESKLSSVDSKEMDTILRQADPGVRASVLFKRSTKVLKQKELKKILPSLSDSLYRQIHMKVVYDVLNSTPIRCRTEH